MNRDEKIGYRIKRLSGNIKKTLDSKSYIGRLDEVTGTHGYILGYLCRHPQEVFYQRDLEKIFSVRRSTMTNVLNLMEKNGLIVREQCAEDKRLNRILPTDLAKRYNEQITLCLEAFERHFVEGIEQEELERFLCTLGKLEANVAKMQNRLGEEE